MGRKRRSRKNFVAIPFTNSFPLLTLADATVLAGGTTTALGEDLFIISVDLYASIRGLTSGEVPLFVGFAHNDLTVTEIKEALSANLANPDDIIQKERSRRPVRRAGQFGRSGFTDLDLNNGVVVRVPIRFTVGNSFELDIWVLNESGAALTTGATIEYQGVIYGRWRR